MEEKRREEVAQKRDSETNFPIETIRKYKEGRSRAMPSFLLINRENVRKWIKQCQVSKPSMDQVVENKAKVPNSIMQWVPWTADYKSASCIKIKQSEFNSLEII